MLCKPSPRGQQPGQGREGAGVLQGGCFGGAASIRGERERDFKPCTGNFATRPRICKVFSGRAASAWGQQGVMCSVLRCSHPPTPTHAAGHSPTTLPGCRTLQPRRLPLFRKQGWG